MKVMIVVTHLLGTGHLARALTLARAFRSSGNDIVLVSGGVPVAQLDHTGITFVQLPPVRSDGVDFSVLLDAKGRHVTDSVLEHRKDILIETLKAHQPDALITELFPFGRRILKNEFLALLNAVRRLPKPPVVCASIRDILAPPSKPKKADETHDIIAAHYDCVLVHSDANVMPLDLSWPVTEHLKTKLHYTGFVAPPAPPPHPERLGEGEIIVSAGGGNVGLPLFECAREMALLRPDLTLRVLVGGLGAETICAHLNADAPSNFSAEGARSDFSMMLNHTQASVSMCGYNTALDVLQTGCPAVFIPFDAGNEVEQSIRAGALARQDGIRALASDCLSPETLAAAITDVLHDPARPPWTTLVDGALETRKIVHKLVLEKQ
jgi:predicted glycosyltransferase